MGAIPVADFSSWKLLLQPVRFTSSKRRWLPSVLRSYFPVKEILIGEKSLLLPKLNVGPLVESDEHMAILHVVNRFSQVSASHSDNSSEYPFSRINRFFHFFY